jgi:hypothetical protein
MEHAASWIEQPFSAAGAERWLKSRYGHVSDLDPQDPIQLALQQDLGLNSLLSSDKGKYLEFLMAGKLKLQSPEPLSVGDSLAVEIEVGAAEPVKTLAVVVGQIPQKMDGMFVSALRFLSVSPVSKAA